MEILLVAFLPLIEAALGGETIGLATIEAALAQVTIAQWIVIAEELLSLANPSLLAQLRKLHPALAAFVDNLKNGKDKTVAAAAVHAFFQSKRPPTIPGYLPDGGVGSIPNPDLNS
jgi:hypothetical protein